jgi:hypothetical protein
MDLSNELLTAWKGYAQTEFTNVESITDRRGLVWCSSMQAGGVYVRCMYVQMQMTKQAGRQAGRQRQGTQMAASKRTCTPRRTCCCSGRAAPFFKGDLPPLPGRVRRKTRTKRARVPRALAVKASTRCSRALQTDI